MTDARKSVIAAPAPPAAPNVADALAARLGATLAGIEHLPGRMAAIAAAIPGRIAFSTSLGIEDQALLHAIAEARAGFDVFTLDTGRLFPETLATLAANEARYGVPVRVIAPEASAIEALVARDGINGFRAAVEARKACCDVRKVQPLKRELAGAGAWITGLRRGQSQDRATVPFAAYDAGFGLVKVNPIADWSLERLQGYVRANDIPVNALHAKGFPSIGCAPCTRAIAPGEDERAGRWWWENEEGKECGLHNRPAAKPPLSGATR